jgi:hypothetical protein
MPAMRRLTYALLGSVPRPVDNHESPFTAGEQFSSLVPNLSFMIQLTAIAAGHKSFHDDVHVCTNGLFVLHAQLRRDGVLGVKSGRFAHSFVQKQGDDPAMKEARTALVFFPDPEATHDTLPRVVPFKGETHPSRVRAPASKARVIGFWIELHYSFAVPA